MCIRASPNLRAHHLDLDCQVVLDGEIVILDSEGRPQFYELVLRRGRGEPVFYVFDVLWLDGEDLRERPLIERKGLLRKLVPSQPSVLLHADHISTQPSSSCQERPDWAGL